MNNIIKLILDNYIYTELLTNDVKIKLSDMKFDSNFYLKLNKYMDDFKDPHTSLKTKNNIVNNFPLSLGIIDNKIINLEKNDILHLDKGSQLISIDNIDLETIINNKISSYKNRNIVLMEIVEELYKK